MVRGKKFKNRKGSKELKPEKKGKDQLKKTS